MEKCVKPYEDKKNETNGKRLPISNSSKTETRTTASTYSKLEYKNVIGVLWPMPVYKELMKKDPPKRQIQTHLINDQRVRGVLREPKHGCPPGCYEVTSLSGSSAEKTGVLAENNEEVDKAYEQACKRNRIGTKETTNKDSQGSEVQSLKITGKTHVDAYASFDDDAFLNSIWGKRVQADTDDKGDGGDEASKKKARKGGSSTGHQKKAVGQPAGSGGAGGGVIVKREPGAKKFQQDCDTSEQVILLVDQMSANLKDGKGYLNITTKQFDSLETKLQSRLTLDLVRLYSTEIDGQSNERGLRILDKLRANEQFVKVAGDVIRSLHASEGELATAEALNAALIRARQVNVEIAERAGEVVCLRAFKSRMKTSSWDDCKKLLDHSLKDGNPLGIHVLGDTLAAQVQTNIMTKAMCELTLVEVTPASVQLVQTFTKEMVDV